MEEKSLREELPELINRVKANSPLIAHNAILFDIFEGNLLEYVLADIANQVSPDYFIQIKHRVVPINILIRVIQKLSKIYARPPRRTIENGNDQDTELLAFYEKSLGINVNMAMANSFFNLFKNVFVEPYLDRGEPKLRVLPSDRFFVYSKDPVNPMRVTHLVKLMGKQYRSRQVGSGLNTREEKYESQIYYVYTDTEFLIVDDDGRVIQEMMAEYDNPGINIYGRIPGVYINRSKHCLIPKPDTDTLALTKIFPVLLTDLNVATMFQCFSVIFGIDVESKNLKMSPNAFWELKSDPLTKTEPKIGTIKPEVDVDKVLSLIRTELTFWLQSRDIKPGAMGDLSTDNIASGVSKVIDEMDSSENRQQQVPYFEDAEEELWEFIIESFHPVAMRDPEFQMKMGFSALADVDVKFPEQRPLIDRSALIDDQIKMIQAGLQTREHAIHEIYPDMSDEQVDERVAEIALGNVTEVTMPDETETETESETGETNGSEASED